MKLLFEVLYQVLLLLAPINPMMTEEIFLTMFKPYLKAMGLKETKSIHLQDWPEFKDDNINLKLEEEMHFTQELTENVRALKDENKIRLRWPNKKLIIEPKEGMPKVKFPEIIKNIGNVRELEVKKLTKVSNDLLKKELKYCNIYLDVSLDEDLLSERIVNDLIRHIQFSRKKNNFKVGEEIALTIGSKSDYLKKYLQKNKALISDKVSAKSFEIVLDDLKQEKGKVFAQLNICPNRECSASLKDNIISKLKKNTKLKCPYCNFDLKEDRIDSITITFKKI